MVNKQVPIIPSSKAASKNIFQKETPFLTLQLLRREKEQSKLKNQCTRYSQVIMDKDSIWHLPLIHIVGMVIDKPILSGLIK